MIETFRSKATEVMHQKGLANWALSLGRQRLGLLTLQNHPQFLQNLQLPRLQSSTQQIDVAALDLIRDRERGIPRYNEFRRQYGLKQLTSFDDFIDARETRQEVRREQEQLVQTLRKSTGSTSVMSLRTSPRRRGTMTRRPSTTAWAIRTAV